MSLHRSPRRSFPWANGALLAALCAASAMAAPATGASGASPTVSSAPSPTVTTPPSTPGLCTERLPAGRERPRITESFPERGLAGHALVLEFNVEHAPGDTVLPGGARLRMDSDEVSSLEKLGFALPSPDGPTHPTVERLKQSGERVITRVRLPFVVLPKEPGRQHLTLPSLPITVTRASGEPMTLCSSSHAVTIESPTANTPNAQPRPNPSARRQLEEWTSLKEALKIGAIALLLGALLAWLISLWLRRKRPLPPPPPPRPPWEVALEELALLKREDLLTQERFAECFARTTDTLRRYLGARYGYDGLESTTYEALQVLRRHPEAQPRLPRLAEFMQDADLVKFARLTPTLTQCQQAMDDAELLVASTRPLEHPQPAPTAPAASEEPS